MVMWNMHLDEICRITMAAHKTHMQALEGHLSAVSELPDLPEAPL